MSDQSSVVATVIKGDKQHLTTLMGLCNTGYSDFGEDTQSVINPVNMQQSSKPNRYIAKLMKMFVAMTHDMKRCQDIIFDIQDGTVPSREEGVQPVCKRDRRMSTPIGISGRRHKSYRKCKGCMNFIHACECDAISPEREVPSDCSSTATV